ncbi:MAG: hypothetical protein IKQ41_09730 [Clostridia bacterium]|nr:hypothetical protein [Clostridia bacterium]
MSAFLKTIVGLCLIRVVLDAALPQGDTARCAVLGVELAAMLCMLRALKWLLSAGG